MQLSDEEVSAAAVTESSLAQAEVGPGIVEGVCQRCRQRALVSLPDGRQYCRACIGLGRITSTTRLWRFPSSASEGGRLTWTGTLTPPQAAAAQAAIASVATGRDHLLWAVTGAGKTEMLFPLIAHELGLNHRVAVVTPRIDVVLELAPRLQAAFAGTSMAVQYGGTPWPEAPTSLLVATTHQLLRYYHHFDLVIVDEVDAFPFSQTPMLAAAVAQANRGPTVYLSATPPRRLKRAARRGQMGVSFLVRRFHGFPLPVPKLVVAPLKQVPTKLSNAVLALLRVGTQGRQCLLFVPRIEWLGPLAQALSQAGYSVETAHAADPDRVAKVQQFRDGTFTVLVTTTILERGVTIPRCSVLVLAADDRQFGASGLIQMAGRAGRSQASPDDPVWFVGRHMTLAMLVARHEIQVINGRKP
ncbi:ComF operon protein 1 [Lacticaseibacillus camelliae DSM 22697 = JCM 13995]|uniref:ComF operon protein 1 n=2 Tax=Lacticaseibacillus camelliae TaxID=381742 RepID=A0A0R2EX09_9LACO|nr:ComF operon protein 1 [Lacticaseibacillus camelliae DSM 22697 = JCM 13995]